MELIIDSLLDALKDGALSIPVLFVAYLLMELLERSNRLSEDMLNHFSRKAGPVIGGLLGIVPQCGISGAAATLFSTGSVTVGTMLAVFFATSDEMLPIMLSALGDASRMNVGLLLRILIGKAALAIVLGYLADLFLNRIIHSRKDIHSFCEREGCECEEEEGSALMSALIHTLKIAGLLIAVTAVLNLVINLIGTERLSDTFINTPVLGEAFLALFGLIPNCSVSVVLTDSYLEGIIGIGGLFAGLLSNAGIGLLVLLRSNNNRRENGIIISIMFLLSFLSGVVIDLIF